MRFHFARTAIIAALLTGGAALADEPTGEVQHLIAQWQEQNTLCRGLSGDDPRTQPACDERQRLGRQLDTLDWCYGKKDQMGYQMEWHVCGPDSDHYE